MVYRYEWYTGMDGSDVNPKAHDSFLLQIVRSFYGLDSKLFQNEAIYKVLCRGGYRIFQGGGGREFDAYEKKYWFR